MTARVMKNPTITIQRNAPTMLAISIVSWKFSADALFRRTNALRSFAIR